VVATPAGKPAISVPSEAFHGERFRWFQDVPRGTEPIDSADTSLHLGRVLREGLQELGCVASQGQRQSLLQLAQLLSSWAPRVNLTGHRSPESIVRRLILDAAALFQTLPEFASLVDLGAGAGFPALPIAVLAPRRQVLLVESRERRHHFQRAAVREMHLENAALRRGRIEALTPEPGDVVIAQAVGPPAKVIPHMLRWARQGGLLVIPGGPTPPDPGPLDGVRDAQVQEYRVPLGGPKRTLWIARADA
jgi:16S rRNA (guanine527-N7)-methyltransferase